ncbi:DMT family transporter [Jannaschia aquimarina]|uniref:RibN_3 protein n=1 Tax=Jannaschia aquimarina TaxID=935700 RepID=A0A0D1D7E7_9RHOB|nr:DMT family transporter [Jannaschia aquimarina]KIT15883.1 Riboflavin transporter [Jannaschia aquimarina]SNS96966.1 EamA-like transporter family protein [Jannaschia aquimarina]
MTAPSIAPLPPVAARADRPALGVLLMLGFCVTAPLSDALSKIAADDFPVLQLVLIRFAVQVAILVPLVAILRDGFAMSPTGWLLTAIRSALQIAGIFLMVTGLTYLPLADAIAIAFVMPFILLLMGYLLMGEEVGPRRLIACAVGFCGTLMVMQPAFEEVGWAVLYPLAVAFVFAAFMLVTRRLGREVGALPMQANSGLIAVAALGVFYAAAPASPALTLAPMAGHLPLLAAMGVLGTVGHLMMTWSLRHAPASTLAPMQYLEIPVAALIGLWLFGDWPNGLAMAGIAVTIATGLYILWREARP